MTDWTQIAGDLDWFETNTGSCFRETKQLRKFTDTLTFTLAFEIHVTFNYDKKKQ